LSYANINTDLAGCTACVLRSPDQAGELPEFFYDVFFCKDPWL